MAAGAAVSVALPAPRTFGGVATQWVVVLTVSTVVALLVDRLTRRLLPLATLLKLSMLFPDKAPSRFKVARKVAGTKALAAELENARRAGVHGDRQQAAETILSLVGMLGDYDSRTRGHSERTQLFVTMLADEMKLKADDRDKLVWAALVHDIGKLQVPHRGAQQAGQAGRRRVAAAASSTPRRVPPSARRCRSGWARGGTPSSSTTSATTAAATRTGSPARRSASPPGSWRSRTPTR